MVDIGTLSLIVLAGMFILLAIGLVVVGQRVERSLALLLTPVALGIVVGAFIVAPAVHTADRAGPAAPAPAAEAAGQGFEVADLFGEARRLQQLAVLEEKIVHLTGDIHRVVLGQVGEQLLQVDLLEQIDTALGNARLVTFLDRYGEIAQATFGRGESHFDLEHHARPGLPPGRAGRRPDPPVACSDSGGVPRGGNDGRIDHSTGFGLHAADHG